MDADTLLENFEILAEAPGGIDRLRELILSLAVRGKLVAQDPHEPTIFDELEDINPNEVGEMLSSERQLETRLPSNWVYAGFRHIGRWVGGNGFPTDKQGGRNKEILFCKVSDMNLEPNSKYIFETVNSLDLTTAKEMRVTPHAVGTVIFPKIGGAIATNKRRLLVKPTVIDNNCMGVSPSSVINPEWLYVLFRSIDLTKYQSGTSIPSISQRVLDEIRFGVPPRAEQKRIVAKVDELMALCDQLEQQQKQRDNLRTATRKSAIDAISTATTPEELEAAWKRINNNWEVIAGTPESINSLRELVLSLGTRIGFGVDIQKSPKRKLNEVSHVSWGNLSLTKTSYVEEGQFLAISAAGPDGRIGHAEHDKHTPVISAIGARCGTMFMPDEKFTAIKNTMTVTPDTNKIDNWYLFYALKGSQLPRRGTAQPFLSKTDIENFEITVPSSLDDQRVIVAKVDELMALCDQLEAGLKVRSEVAEKFAGSVVSAAL